MTHPREIDVVFLITDLAGYTALTEAMDDMVIPEVAHADLKLATLNVKGMVCQA